MGISDLTAHTIVSSISGEATSTSRKVAHFFAQDEPTIVHRAHFKSRPSLVEVIPEGSSPLSSGANDSSTPVRPYESTGKTSLESKISSSKSNRIAQHSSENKKVIPKLVVSHGSSSQELAPISEGNIVCENPLPSKSLSRCSHCLDDTVRCCTVTRISLNTLYEQYRHFVIVALVFVVQGCIPVNELTKY